MFSYLQSACWLLAGRRGRPAGAGIVPWVTRSPGPASLAPSLRKVHFRTRRGCLGRPASAGNVRGPQPPWTIGAARGTVLRQCILLSLEHTFISSTEWFIRHAASSSSGRTRKTADSCLPTGLVGSVCSRCVWLLGALSLTHPLLCRCAMAHPLCADTLTGVLVVPAPW
jgi:hypothetical protein